MPLILLIVTPCGVFLGSRSNFSSLLISFVALFYEMSKHPIGKWSESDLIENLVLVDCVHVLMI